VGERRGAGVTRPGAGSGVGAAAALSASGAWAVRLDLAQLESAAPLRLRRDVDACDADGWLWLRGDELTPELDLELRKLPAVARYAVSRDGELTEAGRRVPSGQRLPAAGWSPLAARLVLRPQPAALPGHAPPRVPLRLERTSAEHPANLLLTTIDTWAQYAEGAPAVRLRPLRFAAASDGRVLVAGSPLPPLAGRRCVERNGIAVPAGFTVSPVTDPGVLRALLGLAAGDVALFDPDGRYERVPGVTFTRATRGAARATQAARGST
jgi:hypothetical protein